MSSPNHLKLLSYADAYSPHCSQTPIFLATGWAKDREEPACRQGWGKEAKDWQGWWSSQIHWYLPFSSCGPAEWPSETVPQCCLCKPSCTWAPNTLWGELEKKGWKVGNPKACDRFLFPTPDLPNGYTVQATTWLTCTVCLVYYFWPLVVSTK